MIGLYKDHGEYYAYSKDNGDSWSETECETCGAGDNDLYEDEQDYNNNNQ